MIKSYLDYYHVDTDSLNIAVTTEGGDCEQCGRSTRPLFYAVAGGGPCRKLCEPCARELTATCGVKVPGNAE
jgi:hypothetical protein